MIYKNSDILGIENAYDRYLARGIEDAYNSLYDDDGDYCDDGYSFEEVD